MGNQRRKFLIDTDAGIDDAQAILMAFAQPDIDVVAITATHGNATAQQVCKNVLRVLKVADRLDVSTCGIIICLTAFDLIRAFFFKYSETSLEPSPKISTRTVCKVGGRPKQVK